MSGEIDSRLRIGSPSDETSEDSLLSDTDSEVDENLPRPPGGLPISTLPSGVCYDDRMRYHAEVAATSAENAHPEDPRRIYYIWKELCEAGLVGDEKDYPPMVEKPLHRIEARPVTKEEVLLVHTDRQFHKVAATAGESFQSV